MCTLERYKNRFRRRYLIVIIIEGHFVLLVQIVEILWQVSYSQLIPPFAMRVFLFVFFLNLIKIITNDYYSC